MCLPKRGKKSKEREEHERQKWFRGGMGFRGGSRVASACVSAGATWADAGTRERKGWRGGWDGE